MENYALKLKKDYEELQVGEKIIFSKDTKSNFRLQDIMGDYGHKPPTVAGSCGSTGKDSSITNSNTFNNLSGLNNLLSDFEQEWFNCPKCNYKADGTIGNQCPGCGLTKEAYTEESGVSCD